MWKAILILPVNAMIVIPGVLLWLGTGTRFDAAPAGPGSAAFWVALALGACGVVLMAWSMGLFARYGDGTPAPWDPPRHFVVRGVYRHTRNPMISGVILFLFAEASIARSPALLAWAVFFLLGNLFYIPRFEEPGLARRFGEAYGEYRRHVPRWIPRLKPWRGGEGKA